MGDSLSRCSDVTNIVVNIANRWETESLASWYSDVTNIVVDIATRWGEGGGGRQALPAGTVM